MLLSMPFCSLIVHIKKVYIKYLFTTSSTLLFLDRYFYIFFGAYISSHFVFGFHKFNTRWLWHFSFCKLFLFITVLLKIATLRSAKMSVRHSVSFASSSIYFSSDYHFHISSRISWKRFHFPFFTELYW